MSRELRGAGAAALLGLIARWAWLEWQCWERREVEWWKRQYQLYRADET